MILACLKRRDGMGSAYVIQTTPDPRATLARNLYETKGEAFPGQQASLAWELAGWWQVSDVRTVDAAMQEAGVR